VAASALRADHPVFELATSLLVFVVFWAIAEWRLGLLLCLMTAILQDPLRKLTPHQPVVFVVFVGVVFAGMCLGALARGVPLTPNIIFNRYRRFAMPFTLFLFLIIVQAVNSYLRFGNPMLPLTGLLTYVLPLISIVYAYQLVSRQGELRINQFIKWYIACIGLALTTVYLEYSGYNWPVLGTVGQILIVYDAVSGRVLPSFAGLFRAPEIAAWHAMTAASFVFLLIFSRGISFTRVLMAVALATVLLGLGLLTGRRKIVIELAVFVSTYFIVWVILERSVGQLAIIAFTGVALIGYFWLAGELREDNVPQKYDGEQTTYAHYVAHSEDAFQAVPSRFVELGIAPVMWAYDQFGLFGAGLGVGTQGTQHFGGGGAIAVAAEGGLGKITLELGVPGLFVMGWIGILIVRQLWRILRFASQYSRRLARISYGLFSVLVANVAGFSVATQAYGDLFILLILSWTLGFFFAIPGLVEREVRARQPATYKEFAPRLRSRPA
jgi:hypothetical protein